MNSNHRSTETGTPVIQAHGLTKAYGRGGPLALNRLNLDVYQGEIFGYLGPNGAGKSTTIRILMDLIRPTSGTATLFGQDVREHAVEIHRRIGFMPGELNLWPGRTGRDIVVYFSKVRGGVNPNVIKQITERLSLDLSMRVREYSSGNKRKLGLLLATMHEPELLILDEPTSGLDPLMQQTFNDMMLEMRAAGHTVFLSSHVLSEVQTICDRVAILRGGVLQAVESVEKLTHADFQWVTITFREPVSPSHFEGKNGITNVTADGTTLKMRVAGDFDAVIRAIGSDYVVNMKVHEPTLEEIFLAYYGEKPVTHLAVAS
ncbi:MAG: ABC transporter-like protein [Chloroflexi bacterium OLB13]|nr:MAG: ABC transporter-like protein [Chloroflexi bacterium OLB13]